MMSDRDPMTEDGLDAVDIKNDLDMEANRPIHVSQFVDKVTPRKCLELKYEDNADIVESLGLDPNVITKLVLTLECGTIPRIEVTYIAETQQCQNLARYLNRRRETDNAPTAGA